MGFSVEGHCNAGLQTVHSRSEPGAVVTKAVLRAADRVGLTARVLAAVIGLSEATIARMSRDKFRLEPDSKPFELALLFIGMIRSLDAIAGGDEEVAASWLGNPSAVLGARPIEKLQTVSGLIDSSRIWTRAALSSEFRRYGGAWRRLVEGKHRLSTLKLADTLAAQPPLKQLPTRTESRRSRRKAGPGLPGRHTFPLMTTRINPAERTARRTGSDVDAGVRGVALVAGAAPQTRRKPLWPENPAGRADRRQA